MTLTWHMYVDWDGDGVYEADEGGNMFGFSVKRGRQHMVKQDGKGFEPPAVGQGTILLRDLERRYDPWNSASPLYPHVLPQKRLKVTVDDGTGEKPVVVGQIREVHYEEGNVPKARIDFSDAWIFLQKEVYVPMQRNLTTDQALHMVLDEAGWSAVDRDIDLGLNTIRAWWVDGKSARLALHELAEAEYGFLDLRADGIIRFRNRQANIPSTAAVSAGDILRGIRLPLPWDSIRTVARVRAYQPRDVSGLLSTFQAPVRVEGSSTEEMFIDVLDVYIDSISSLTWQASENEDGTGADLTGQFNVTATVLSPTRVKLNIENTGTQRGYLQKVDIYGTGVDMKGYVDRVKENAAAKAVYGERLLVVDNKWLQDIYVAKDFADHFAWWYGTPKPEQSLVRVRLKNRPALQFGVDVGDVLDVNIGSITGRFRVVHIEHRWTVRTGQMVETTWTLHPHFSFSNIYWIFPTRIGETSRFGF